MKLYRLEYTEDGTIWQPVNMVKSSAGVEQVGAWLTTVKPVLNGHSKRKPKLVFKTDYRLMQVKSIAECSKRAFCNTSVPQ